MTEPSTRVCVVHSKPTEARHGLLCINHFERLASMLRDIEDQAAVLSAVPSMQQGTGNRGGGLASHRAPARLDAVVAGDPRRGEPTLSPHTWNDPVAYDDTASILGVLGSWARVVREERDWDGANRATISSERKLLTRNLDWIAGQPWVDEFYNDVRQLVGQLTAANGHRADRPYSRCPSIVNGQNCTGDVWLRDEAQAVWRIYTDRCAQSWEEAPGAAVCDTCGAVWATDADKARLKRMVDDMAADLARPRTDDGRRMLTVKELAAKLRISENNVRVKAHRLGAAPISGHYDPEPFERQDKASA